MRLLASIKWLGVILVAGALGVALGAGVRHILQTKAQQKVRSERLALSAARLGETSPLQVGDSLLDHTFESVDGDTVSLHSAIASSTYLMIIHPDCSSCIDELQRLKLKNPSKAACSRIVFVSYGNPRILKDVWETIELEFPLLYDHRAQWCTTHEISDFPLAIKLSDGLFIEGVFIGGLLDEEITALFN